MIAQLQGQLGDAAQGRLDTGRGLPDPTLRIRAGDDAGDRARRREAGQAVLVQGIGRADVGEIERRVLVGRDRKSVISSTAVSTLPQSRGGSMSKIARLLRDEI